MALADRKALKEAAAEILQQKEQQSKRMVLLYAGASAGIALVIFLINHVLGNLIGDTSGIGSFQTRTTLETVQRVLDLLGSLLPVFLSMGYVYAMLRLAEGQSVEDKTLLQGFRHFGPVLRKMVLEGLLFFGLSMITALAGATVLSFTPLVTPMVEAMMPYLGMAELTMEAQTEIMEAGAPLLACCMIICLVVLVPVTCRLRMSNYVLMDHPEAGAVYAMAASFRMTRRHVIKILLLELSFWWYYLAIGIAIALGMGGELLQMMGVTLPVSQEVSYLIFSALAIAGQFGVQYLALNKVEMTFVQAYRELRQEASLPVLPGAVQQERRNPFA